MSDKPVPTKGALEKTPPEGEAEEGKRRGPLAWVLGWVAVPGVVLGGIFGGGVLVGAHFHDSWVTSVFVWIFG